MSTEDLQYLLIKNCILENSRKPSLNMTHHSGATSHSMVALVPKFTDPDADIRYMSLSDLTKMLGTAPQSVFSSDISACTKLVDGLVQALDDKNGEVQNQSLKW